MKQTRSFLESQITKQRFKPCLPQNDIGSPKTKYNAKRNRFHWKEWFLLKEKAFSKMIGCLNWFSLYFSFVPIKLSLEIKSYELIFCYAKFFLKEKNMVFFEVYLNVQKFYFNFLCLAWIIIKQPLSVTNNNLLRILFDLLGKIH